MSHVSHGIPAEPSGLLVPKGQPGASPNVIIRQQAYFVLERAIRIRMPAETCGVLVGSREERPGGDFITVEEAIPIELVTSGDMVLPDEQQVANLKSLFASNSRAKTSGALVGWFLAQLDLSEA